jgi:type II secretory pathway pseudopilin PulG
MDKKPIWLKRNKGFAFIAVYLAIAVLLIFATVFINQSVSQNNAANIFKRQTQALNAADAGLDHAIVWLRAQGAPPSGNYTNPWGSTQSLGTSYYNVVITDLGFVGGSTTIRRYMIVSTGTAGNMNRVLRSYVQVDNYARYIWYTDRETFNGTNVWFWSQDHLNGPTHTNGHYNIYGNPIFDGEVRSVDDYIRYYNNGNNINLSELSNSPYDLPVFNNGFVFGADQSTMPSTALSLRSAASSAGVYLTGNTTVVLNANGTMNVTNYNKNPDWISKNMPLPANGALFVNNGSLTISGTLNGRLTAGASIDVKIPSNLVYASDPLVNPDSDDTLGIISERDIVIPNNAPTNVEINACLMALNTSFYLQDWSSVAAKGTLDVFGGIIQKERGPVGTFNASTGQKLSGYSKEYSYDARQATSPPPFMPTTGDYITLSWEEN